MGTSSLKIINLAVQFEAIYMSQKSPFILFNVKVIGADGHTSIYDKRDDLRFPIVNFP